MSSSGLTKGSPTRSGVRAGIVLLLLTLAFLAGSGVTSAVPPFRIPNQITDQNNSLAGHTAEIQNAMDKLYSEDKLQLWVVYVDSFDGATGPAWTAESFADSGFGTDTVLLAVATLDSAYGFYAPSGSAVTKSQLSSVASNDIVPKLKSKDWSGAAVGAADGLRTTVGGGSSGSKTWILWLVLLVLLVGGYLWFRQARKSKAARVQAGSAAGESGGTTGGRPGRAGRTAGAVAVGLGSQRAASHRDRQRGPDQ